MINKALPFFHLTLLLPFLFTSACSSQSQTAVLEKNTKPSYKNYSIEDVVTCGFQDREGNLWFGTNREGLYRYNGKAFTNFTKHSGFCSNRVSAIIEDKEGNVWFGTDDGICNYDRRSFNHIPIPFTDTSSSWLDKVYPIVNPNAVSCLIQDQVGNLWFGTYGGGAYRYDCKNFTSFLADKGRKQSDSLYHNVISSIMEDRDGNIWFTSMTHGGVSRYRRSAYPSPYDFTHFTPEDGLSDDMVRTSFQDSKGNIWFGSLGNRKGGLDRLSPSDPIRTGPSASFSNFNESDGLCSNNVGCIFEDKTGKLWLGSGRGNLCVYDPSKAKGEAFEEFKTEDGQTFSHIVFIMEDRNGTIWFGGNYGKLFAYDGKIVTDFTQKKNG